jgi:probable HAF family extracellular repeat protein
VVGFSQDSAGDFNSTVAFVWQNGIMTDLNTLIPANSPVFLVEALGINNRGQITGYMLDIPSGEVHGFLATPLEDSGSAPVAQAGSREAPRVVLPEKVREMLRHQHHWPGLAK